MLSHKVLILSLLLSTSAFAYDFKAANGTKWSFDIPKGWHIIDAPEGIAEGAQLRLSSNPNATWDNPMPPAGYALISIGFYMAKNNPDATAKAAEMKKLGRQKFHNQTTVMDYKGIEVDGYQIPIWIVTNNNDVDVSAALYTITSTLKVKP